MFPEFPQYVVPVLEVDGQYNITQSMAIARFLARRFGNQYTIVLLHMKHAWCKYYNHHHYHDNYSHHYVSLVVLCQTCMVTRSMRRSTSTRSSRRLSTCSPPPRNSSSPKTRYATLAFGSCAMVEFSAVSYLPPVNYTHSAQNN